MEWMPTHPIRYPSDLRDEEWEYIRSLVPAPKSGEGKRGRPLNLDRRSLVNAIFYIVRSGCAWRMLPRDFGPWQTVYGYYRRWYQDWTWRFIHDAVRDWLRKTEKDKVSYMVGADVGRGLTQIKDDLDLAIVVQALQDEFNGKNTKMTAEEGQQIRQEFMQKLQAKRVAEEKAAAEKNKAEGAAFLAKNKSKAGVKTTASGLQYEVIKEGSGKKPVATDTVKVDYTGTKNNNGSRSNACNTS